MKTHLSFTYLLLVLFYANVSIFSQEKTITCRHFTGYVKDSDNNPVADAKVCGWDKSGRPINGRIPCSPSQKDGSFSLDIRKWEGETYNIFVEDSEKGYPNPNSALYENFFRDKQIIAVDATSEVKPIEIQLGAKAGKAVLKIVDDESGKAVESGMVKMCRTDNPEICQSLSSAFPKGVVEILTPNSPVTLKIELWDGKEWKEWFAMDENNNLIQTIQVELGQKKEIKVRLKNLQENSKLTEQDKSLIIKSVLEQNSEIKKRMSQKSEENNLVIKLSKKNIDENLLPKFPRLEFVLLNTDDIQNYKGESLTYREFQMFEFNGFRVTVVFSTTNLYKGFFPAESGATYEYQKINGEWVGKMIGAYDKN